MFLTCVSFLALECGTAEHWLEKEETEQGWTLAGSWSNQILDRQSSFLCLYSCTKRYLRTEGLSLYCFFLYGYKCKGCNIWFRLLLAADCMTLLHYIVKRG